MDDTRQPAAVACSLSAGDLTQRAGRWRALTDRSGLGVVMTSDGLELAFCADDGVDQELQALAALERDCCAFATWTVSRVDDRLVLSVSGGDDEMAVGAVQDMFASLRLDLA
ncbi:MAG TPA: hypothetical protein VMR14_18785 [Streptosporangiaceae bacterium]|jgi:hypothetical protein|nr:hypothetical protein [Streptosporangiaceae bacterium]